MREVRGRACTSESMLEDAALVLNTCARNTLMWSDATLGAMQLDVSGHDWRRCGSERKPSASDNVAAVVIANASTYLEVC